MVYYYTLPTIRTTKQPFLTPVYWWLVLIAINTKCAFDLLTIDAQCIKPCLVMKCKQHVKQELSM
jgi:hypothetical protein